MGIQISRSDVAREAWHIVTNALAVDPRIGFIGKDYCLHTFPPQVRIVVDDGSGSVGPVGPASLEIQCFWHASPASRQILLSLAAAATIASWSSTSPGLISRIVVRKDDTALNVAWLAVTAAVIQAHELTDIRTALGESIEGPTIGLADALTLPRDDVFSFSAELNEGTPRWEDAGHMTMRRGEVFSLHCKDVPAQVTALLDEHPKWGPGVAVRTIFATPVASDDALSEAIQEISEGDESAYGPGSTDMLGAWCRSPNDELAYVSFIPEPALQPGSLSRLVDVALDRAGWLSRYVEQRREETDALRHGRWL